MASSHRAMYFFGGNGYNSSMIEPIVLQKIQERYALLQNFFDQRTGRLWAAAEARVIGHGGVLALSRNTGLARETINGGLKELADPSISTTDGRIRCPGGGRTKLTEAKPEITDVLETLLKPDVRGDPMSPLRWTCLSTRKIGEEMGNMGFRLSHQTVKRLLHEMDFSLQGNQKIIEGTFTQIGTSNFVLLMLEQRNFR